MKKKLQKGFQKGHPDFVSLEGRKKQAKILKKKFKGKNNPNWQGGKFYSTYGYVLISKPDHPKADHHGCIYEHRLVMEEYLGRYLEKWEWIHHKNGIKDDNRLENLEIVISKKHFGQMRCPYCLKDFLIK